MATLDIRDLQQGSFKGIPFLFTNSDTSGGRKNAFYEYPKTDKRGFSDLGRSLRTLTLIFYIQGDNTSNYFDNRDAMLSALDSEGSGILVHPFLGEITVAIDGDYSFREDIGTLNRVDFTVTFKEVSEPVKPAPIDNNIPNIEKISGEVLDGVEADVSDNYVLSSNDIVNFDKAKAKAQEIGNKFAELGENVEKVTDVYNEFVETLRVFDAQINLIINAPIEYAARIRSLNDQLRLIASNATERFSTFTKLFGFGSGDDPIPSNTISQQERKQNNEVINNAINADALAQAYAVFTSVDIANEEEFTDFLELLNNQWDFLQDKNLSRDIRELLLDLRGEVEKYIETLNIPEITNVDTVLTSPTVLSYTYYGNTTRADDITNLNALKDAAIIEGNIKLESDFS